MGVTLHFKHMAKVILVTRGVRKHWQPRALPLLKHDKLTTLSYISLAKSKKWVSGNKGQSFFFLISVFLGGA